MKTIQIKTGRWYAVPGKDGAISYSPVVQGVTARDIAIEIDEDDPPAVAEVVGTGIRLYDMVDLDGDEWRIFGNDAQALAAAAFRIRETR